VSEKMLETSGGKSTDFIFEKWHSPLHEGFMVDCLPTREIWKAVLAPWIESVL
jgi:hypothetical protein